MIWRAIIVEIALIELVVKPVRAGREGKGKEPYPPCIFDRDQAVTMPFDLLDHGWVPYFDIPKDAQVCADHD